MIKGLIMMTGIGFALIIGLTGSKDNPLPKYKKILTITLMFLAAFLSLYPPVAGNFEDLKNIVRFSKGAEINVLCDIQETDDSNVFKAAIADTDDFKYIITNDKKAFRLGNSQYVLKMKYNSESDQFFVIDFISKNPFYVIPYVSGLGERIRIINFHVPVAWVSVLAFLMSMIYSVQYLRKNDFNYDIYASTAAGLGMMFTILATISGSVWAKFNWGSFWNWDPRETSIFILLLIYAAYFSLRSALNNEEQRAKLSAVYSIAVFAAVPFLVFVLPRLSSGLHPGSGDEATMGPVLSSSSEMMNFGKQIIFSISFAAYTLLYFWIFNISLRVKKINYLINSKKD
jgi:heme exporter protein C